MSTPKLGSGESKLETGISYLLITGVMISLALEITGIIMAKRTGGNLSISQDPAMFIHGTNFFSFIATQFQAGDIPAATRVMTAGIIVLILTPFIRLIASIFYFGWERNIKYTLITLFVLVVITLSLALH